MWLDSMRDEFCKTAVVVGALPESAKCVRMRTTYHDLRKTRVLNKDE